MNRPIVWVEGIIGSGKTTLTKQLAERLGYRALMEPVDSNPYLERFYRDPKRWAFPMQIELLHRRYAMHRLASYEAISEGGVAGVIMDRGLPGDRVFAHLHMVSGNMDPIEWETYDRAYRYMACSLTPPTLLLFLDVDPEVALARVQRRARGCEVNLDLGYLRALRAGYYDLMVEIDSGQHQWSRGIMIARVPWNLDNQPIDTITSILQHS